MKDKGKETKVGQDGGWLHYVDGPFCMIPTVVEDGVSGWEVLPSKTSSFDELVDEEKG